MIVISVIYIVPFKTPEDTLQKRENKINVVFLKSIIISHQAFCFSHIC